MVPALAHSFREEEMQQPTQTDRLEVGHIATFKWTATDRTTRAETFRVAENVDNSTWPPSVSNVWLRPFLGRSVGYRAEVPAGEGDVLMMELISIQTEQQFSAQRTNA
jgi:hypothetical protein